VHLNQVLEEQAQLIGRQEVLKLLILQQHLVKGIFVIQRVELLQRHYQPHHQLVI